MGVLPTKGLTLPLMSYGGTSLIVSCLQIALLARVDHEQRARRGAAPLGAPAAAARGQA
jgi:cell division protein FtsW